MTARRARIAAALFGFVWYLLLGGAKTLNPMNLAWVLDGDWRQHLLGFLYFQREPWTFPLGTITALPWPIGTNIGFTDSNPLISILLKPFAAWLPGEYQYIGPWLALCFMLQGYFGAMLSSVVTRHPVQQMLGGCLFVLSPVLSARLGHDTLCAQWLLLGLMYVGLREYTDAADVRRGTRLAVILATLSASFHPYLAAMSATLSIAAYLRLWRAQHIRMVRALALIVLTLGSMAAVMWVIGYFKSADTASVGFERYAADLATLFDSAGYSKLLPNLNLEEGRWEGFGFLGIGGLIAAALAILVWIRNRSRLPRGAWIMVLAVLLMGVYALSSRITFMNDQVARVNHIYDHLDFIKGPFRASGRFIWPLHYIVLLAGIWAVCRLRGREQVTSSLATGILAALIAIQAADFRLTYPVLEQKKFRQASISDFEPAKGKYQHMAVYPMQILGTCGGVYEEDHVYRFMLQAYRMHLTFNSGIFARLPTQKLQQYCGDLYRSVDAGQLDPQTIYIVSPRNVERLKDLGASCGRSDGDWICVSKDSDEVFRTYLATGKIIDRKSP